MDFKEACHYLRISPQLLKWYGSYAAKHDGRKLAQSSNGDLSESELKAFESHLRGPWPSKKVPTGIGRELLVEACGLCGVCEQPCEKLQMAHIKRNGVEVTFYCQHPENLIGLCGHCHDRYDDLALKTISLDVVLAAKERAVSRKMEAVDRDVRIARAVRVTVDEVKDQLRAGLAGITAAPITNALLWQSGAASLLSATTRGLFGEGAVLVDPMAPSKSLASLSGSLEPTQQITHAMLDGYALEASGEALEAPSDWELLEEATPDHECSMCGNLKDTVEYECQDCGHCGSDIDAPDYMEENDAGTLVPVYSDARGDTHRLACEKCHSENVAPWYYESLCSNCEYRLSSDD